MKPDLLREHWYIAARSTDLRARPIARTIFGENLALFRDAAGRPAALLDRCAHRNMALSLGAVRDGCIECPYHGWRYNASGECRHIPSLGPDAKLPRVSVRSLPAREQDGYVWLWMGAREPRGEPFPFPHCADAGWTTFTMQTRFPAAVEPCLENFLDCPHTVFVHKGWFRSADTRALTALVRRSADEVAVEFRGEPISDSVVSRLLFPKGRELKHTDRFLMPNLSRVDYDFGPDRHFIITSQCTPISATETEVHTVISFTFGRLGPLVRLFFEPLSRRIIRQDVDILRKQSRQFEKFGEPKFAHVETDLLGLHIASLRRGEVRTEEREITIRF